MKLSLMAKAVEKFTIDNSPLLLTGLAAAGTVTTAVLTGKAAFKAGTILAEEDALSRRDSDEYPFLTSKEQFKLVWPLFVPAVGSAAITVTCVIAANRIGTRRAAAMAAAYTISENAFEKYREKIVEKIGPIKERETRDEVAQDRIRENPVNNTTVIMTEGGQVLCLDAYTMRYFKSDMETLRQAENKLNRKLLHQQYASLNDYYDLIGLPHTSSGEEVGWNADKELELHITGTVSEDNKPCFHVDFYVKPIRDYFKVH